MAQQEESPLIAGARKIYDTLDKWGANKDVNAKDTTDYSWHANKVDEATKSFSNKADVGPKLGQRKKSKRKRAAKR